MSKNGEQHYSKNKRSTLPSGGEFLVSEEENITDRLDEEIKASRLKETAEGIGPKARSARHKIKRRKHPELNLCPEGHEYNAQNTLYNAAGSRYCLLCLQDRRIYTEEKKEAQKAISRNTENKIG